MDPGSIAGLALAAGTALLQASTSLYQFIEATKRYENSVLALRREIDGLTQLVDAIKESLEQDDLSAVEQTTKAPRGLWISLRSELVSSELTGKQLSQIVGNHAVKRRRFWNRPMAAVKLQISKDDVAILREQALAHKSNLQCSLSMINLHVACQHPDQTRRLENRIEELLSSLQSRAEGAPHQKLPHGIEGVAREMLSGASIVVEASERGSAFKDDATVTYSVRDRINHWIAGVDEGLEDRRESLVKDRSVPIRGPFTAPRTHHSPPTKNNDFLFIGSTLSELDASPVTTMTSLVIEKPKLAHSKANAIASELRKVNCLMRDFESTLFKDFLEAVKSDTDLAIDVIGRVGFCASMYDFFGHAVLGIAAYHGAARVVEALLSSGANPNILDDDPEQMRPIHHATKVKNESSTLVIKALIDHGADVNVTDVAFWSYTPLMYAVSNLTKSEINLLLTKGADPLLFNERRETAVSIAIMLKRAEAIAPFIEHGFPLDSTVVTINGWNMRAFDYAIASDCSELACDLIKQGQRFNTVGGENDETRVSNRKSCMAAVRKEYYRCVEMMLQAGLDIKQMIQDGAPLLHLSVVACNWQITELLLNHGADPNAAMYVLSYNGASPLHLAMKRRYADKLIIKMLLDKGARTDVKDGAGKEPLQYALEDKTHVKFWAAIAPNAPIHDAYLPLAIENGHYDAVEVLLAQVQRQNRRNSKRQKLIDDLRRQAISEDNFTLYNLLLDFVLDNRT